MGRNQRVEMQLHAARCITFLYRCGQLSENDPRVLYRALPTVVRYCSWSGLINIIWDAELNQGLEIRNVNIPVFITVSFFPQINSKTRMCRNKDLSSRNTCILNWTGCWITKDSSHFKSFNSYNCFFFVVGARSTGIVRFKCISSFTALRWTSAAKSKPVIAN